MPGIPVALPGPLVLIAFFTVCLHFTLPRLRRQFQVDEVQPRGECWKSYTHQPSCSDRLICLHPSHLTPMSAVVVLHLYFMLL